MIFRSSHELFLAYFQNQYKALSRKKFWKTLY